jgi:hypothetical protein
MFVYTRQYGLGAEEEDIFVRWLSIVGNIADQLYYPCEHVAWAADAKVLHVDSARWWTLSTALWGLSLLLGIARSTLKVTMSVAGACPSLPVSSATLPQMLRDFRVIMDNAEAEAKAEELHGHLHQPAAPEQAEGHGGTDAVGGADAPQQPG